MPLLGHAGLALSIGLGATINAVWLFVGLKRGGWYQPAPGWGRFALQVVVATLAHERACWLCAAVSIDWIGLAGREGLRIALAGGLPGAARPCCLLRRAARRRRAAARFLAPRLRRSPALRTTPRRAQALNFCDDRSLRLHAPTALEYFASLVADDASLLAGRGGASRSPRTTIPALDCQTVLAEIDALAARLKSRIASDAAPMQRLRLLNRFFFQELGFAGNVNDYYDARNSYLHFVLQTRRGIPITLAVLYVEIASQIGLHAQRRLVSRATSWSSCACRRARS